MQKLLFVHFFFSRRSVCAPFFILCHWSKGCCCYVYLVDRQQFIIHTAKASASTFPTASSTSLYWKMVQNTKILFLGYHNLVFKPIFWPIFLPFPLVISHFFYRFLPFSEGCFKIDHKWGHLPHFGYSDQSCRRSTCILKSPQCAITEHMMQSK